MSHNRPYISNSSSSKSSDKRPSVFDRLGHKQKHSHQREAERGSKRGLDEERHRSSSHQQLMTNNVHKSKKPTRGKSFEPKQGSSKKIKSSSSSSSASSSTSSKSSSSSVVTTSSSSTPSIQLKQSKKGMERVHKIITKIKTSVVKQKSHSKSGRDKESRIKPMIREERERKRRLSVDSYGSESKRSRNEEVSDSPRDRRNQFIIEESSNKRQKESSIIRTAPPAPERIRRAPPASPKRVAGNELIRERNFHDDNKRKFERMAPARSPPTPPIMHHHPPQRMSPFMPEREHRMLPIMDKRNMTPQRQLNPYNSLPPPRNDNFHKRLNPMIPPLINRPPREPIIPNCESINSHKRIDMWLDETVSKVTPPPLLTPPSVLKKTSVTHEKVDKPLAIKKEKTPDPPLDEVLSEISEVSDDELLLNEDEIKTEAKEEDESILPSLVTVKIEVEEKEIEKSNDEVKQTTSEEVEREPVPESSSSSVVIKEEVCGEREDEDLLENMDFEEISDDELESGECSKVGIVDALGVDWSILLRTKEEEKLSPDDGIRAINKRRSCSLFDLLREQGIRHGLLPPSFTQTLLSKIHEREEREGRSELTSMEELQNPILRHRREFRKNLINRVGLGSSSRALSARRDMALRRCLMGLPPKSLKTTALIEIDSSAH